MKTVTFDLETIPDESRRDIIRPIILERLQVDKPELFPTEPEDVSPAMLQDLEAEIPSSVRKFKEKIRRTDAILFATPEHNYSVSALLKNAIEWGNRPETDNSWDGKPAAIMSASTSPRGGARAQLHPATK